MSVQRWLQILMALLTVLGAVMLGVGLNSPFAPLLVGFLALTSLCFTDLLGWFRLPRLLVELVALLALVAGFLCLRPIADVSRFNAFIGEYGDHLPLAIACLLIFLQTLFLYQRKTDRAYWYLLLFSILQVVVAAGMSSRIELGVLQGAYGIVAFFAMALFYLHRCGKRFEVLEARSQRQAEAPERPSAAPVAYQQVGANFLGQRLPGWKYVRNVGVMALTTLAFGGVFLCSAPRSEDTYYNAPVKRSVGFTRGVSLEDVEPLLLSDQLVMRVTFRRFSGGEENYAVRDDPYFRGVPLADYSFENGRGRWRSEPQGAIRRVPKIENPPQATDLVRQEILLEPTDEPELFGVFPVFRTERTPSDIRLVPRRSQLHRTSYTRMQSETQYRYELATTGFRDGRQLAFTLHQAPPDSESLEEDTQDWLGFDVQQLPTLKKLADRIVREDAGGSSDPVVRARALEHHFLAPGAYTYSISVKRPAKPDVDPLEDFVGNHRTGHCEYFASALTLMLRSQGVPARMIMGYAGGQFNSVGNFYMVREFHAHAWVEAYLAPDQLPEEARDLQRSGSAGAWLRLDPTPASGDADAARGLLSTMDESIGLAHVLWNDYMLGLDTQQQRSFLDPLILGTTSLFRGGIAESFSLRIAESLARRRFPWRALSAVLAATALVLACGFAARRWGPVFELSWGRRKLRRSRRLVHVDFYQRFEKLLARWGLRRGASQTHREFAASAAAALDAAPSQPPRPVGGSGDPPTTCGSGDPPTTWMPVSGLLQQVVEAFYRVRFGGSTLDPSETDAIRTALTQLETALAVRNRSRPSRKISHGESRSETGREPHLVGRSGPWAGQAPRP